MPPKRKLLTTDPITGAVVDASSPDKPREQPTGSSNMTDWNVADTCAFLSGIGLGEYAGLVGEHEVDGGALSVLDSVESTGFSLLGIKKFGHVHKIAAAVAAFKEQPATPEKVKKVEGKKAVLSPGGLGRLGGDKAVGGGLDLVEPPNEFFCPLSFEMMADPVVALDGHTYERTDIER